MRRRTRRAAVPIKKEYAQYKAFLREDFVYECVFCTIHENDLGGPRGMHVEHLRPKSIERFSHLECDYTNLLYACPVCNGYKGKDWPSDTPVEHGLGYPDPCEVDYDDHISLLADQQAVGLTPVGTYLVRRLRLNRRQLQKLRAQREALRNATHAAIRVAEDTIAQADQMAARTDLPEELYAYIARVRAAAEEERAAAELAWERRLHPLYTLEDYY